MSQRTCLFFLLLSLFLAPCFGDTITYLFGDKDGFGTSSGQIADGTPFSASTTVTEPDEFFGTDLVFAGNSGEPTLALVFDSYASINSITLVMATTNVADSGPGGTGLFTNDFLTLDGQDVAGAFDGINQDAPDVTGTLIFSSQQGTPSVNVHSGTFPLSPSLFNTFLDGAVDLRVELSSNDGIVIDFIELTIDGTLSSAVPEPSSISLLALALTGLFFRKINRG